MRLVRTHFITTIVLIAALGCAEQAVETPPEVQAEFHSLLQEIENDPVEVAARQLTIFLRANAVYDVADTVQLVLDELSLETSSRYHEARELARAGEFDRAEQILRDIVDYLPQSNAAELAAQYLEFEFYYSQAQWLLVRQRHKEAGAVARAMLDRDLTGYQVQQVEQILDNVGFVDAAYSQSELQETRSACRQVAVMLAQQFVMMGEYPSTFTLEDARNMDAFDAGYSLKGLSAIEDFRVVNHQVSFVGVSKSGRHRVRVVDGAIE